MIILYQKLFDIMDKNEGLTRSIIKSITNPTWCLVLLSCLISVFSHYADYALAQENKTNVAGGLTRQSLDPVLDSLSGAREELLRKNSPSAFIELSEAASQLFNITFTANMSDSEAISEQLEPLQHRIERSRAVLLRDNNMTAAVWHLNAADAEFIKLTLKLR